MLILRRKPGEAVSIGDRIEIKVVEVSAGRVTLGIEAPDDVLILRSEIQLARAENRAAARGVSGRSIDSILAHLKSAGRLP